MHDVLVRKQVVVVEEILHDGGSPPATSQRKGAILAVVGNPFAGRYVEDIQPFMEDLKPLGLLMAGRLAEALGGPAAVTGHGKGAIVGAAGELEHGALWHARVATPCARSWETPRRSCPRPRRSAARGHGWTCR